MVFFACFVEGLLPFWMVYRIGVILGLQADAAPGCVNYASLTGGLGKVAAVELYAGAIGGDGHAAAAFRIGQNGAGIAENFEIVIIAIGHFQRFVSSEDIPADGLRRAEIHGSACDAAVFTGGDVLCIGYGIETGGHRKHLLVCVLLPVVTSQIEVAVVGHVEYGVCIRNAIVGDVERIAFQRISHIDVGVSGEALVASGAEQVELDAVVCMRNNIPHSVVIIVRAAVEIVGLFVGGHGPSFIV